MPKHIGIVGCSAEGAALCYRTICLEGEDLMGEHLHPEVSMHTHPLGDYTPFIKTGNQQGVADLMLSSADKLQRCGADFLICPDNTIHEAFDIVRSGSALPWLHIAEVAEEEAFNLGYKRLGITGTRYLMEGPVYPDALQEKDIDYLIPGPAEREEINSIIFDELVKNILNPNSIDFFLKIIEKFKAEDCDAIVLGCTEIPLIINDHNSPLPVLDSTRLLARAALKEAIGQGQDSK